MKNTPIILYINLCVLLPAYMQLTTIHKENVPLHPFFGFCLLPSNPLTF